MSRGSLFAVVVTLALSTPAFAQAPAPAALTTYNLPAALTFPEGVASDGTALYTASAENGAIAKVTIASGAAEMIAPAGTLVPAGSSTFPGVLGMKVDGQRRLWVAGGAQPKIFVFDLAAGKLLKTLDLPSPSGNVLNDLVFVGSHAYFTDTKVPTLWRVALNGAEIGAPEPFVSFNGTALQYDNGRNLNGIAATADGKTLVVVQMDKGLLFKIDVATKAVSPIETAGADLSGSDGLVLDGHTLYVVRQTAVEIATVTLSDDLSKGTVAHRFKDPSLAWPATAAKVGDRLVVVNTQFNTRANKSQKTPFTLLSVPLSRLR
jgi:Cu-Zn family superoxide dismutase